MNESDTNGTPDDDWEDYGELDWTEFDWERYLRTQDKAVGEYWRCYHEVGERPDRIDEVARRLGWELVTEPDEETADVPSDEVPEFDDDPYTVHRNHVFVAARALFAALHAVVENVATDAKRLPPAEVLPLAGALHRAELAALFGVQSLDLGDRALGIAQLKRGLAELHSAFAHLPAPSSPATATVGPPDFPENVRRWIFDLREIFLRVAAECREDLLRQPGEDDEGS